MMQIVNLFRKIHGYPLLISFPSLNHVSLSSIKITTQAEIFGQQEQAFYFDHDCP